MDDAAANPGIGDNVAEKLQGLGPVGGSSGVADAVAEKMEHLGGEAHSTPARSLSPDAPSVQNAALDAMDVDAYPPAEQEPDFEDDDLIDVEEEERRDNLDEDDPLGWDFARAQRVGQRARGPEDDLFDEEEEADEEVEEMHRRVIPVNDDEDEDADDGAGEGGDGAGDDGGPVGGPAAAGEPDGGGGDGDGDDDGEDGDDDGDQAPGPDPEPQPPPPQRRRIVRFGGRAGKARNGAAGRDGYQKHESQLPQAANGNNPYHPFATKMDWEVASWAKNFGIGANALTALLKIDGVSPDLTCRTAGELIEFCSSLTLSICNFAVIAT